MLTVIKNDELELAIYSINHGCTYHDIGMFSNRELKPTEKEKIVKAFETLKIKDKITTVFIFIKED